MDGVGSYTIYYDANNGFGDAQQVTRTVNVIDVVRDTSAPRIVLNGGPTIDVVLGGTYVELGATAQDDVDGDLTSSIAVGGDVVDTERTGRYVVTYDVRDSAGNPAERVLRTVNVTSPLADNPADANVNLGLLPEAVLSGTVTGGRGTPRTILYDPVKDDYVVSTNFNEYGVLYKENLGRPGADDGFKWQVDWESPKLVNYITFGGTYPNQPQPNTCGG